MEKEFYTELVDPYNPYEKSNDIMSCILSFLYQLKNEKYLEYWENSINPEISEEYDFEKHTTDTLLQKRRAFKAFLEICSKLLREVNEIEEENNKIKHNLITEIEYFDRNQQKKILSIYGSIENKKCLTYSLHDSRGLYLYDKNWEENRKITKPYIKQCFWHFVKSYFAIPLSGQSVEDRVHINFISKEAKEKAINQFQNYLINDFHFTIVE